MVAGSFAANYYTSHAGIFTCRVAVVTGDVANTSLRTLITLVMRVHAV
jgi:hypothetical protein